MLHGKFVGGIEPGEIAAGLDQFVVGMEPEAPIFLQIARVRSRDGHRRRKLEKRRPGEGLDGDGQHQPGGDDKAEREKRSALIEALEGHG